MLMFGGQVMTLKKEVKYLHAYWEHTDVFIFQP